MGHIMDITIEGIEWDGGRERGRELEWGEKEKGSPFICMYDNHSTSYKYSSLIKWQISMPGSVIVVHPSMDETKWMVG